MNIRDMINRVQVQVRDRRFWNDDQVISLINTIQDELTTEFNLQVADYYEFTSVVGQQRYQMPSNLISIELLYYDNGNIQRIAIIDRPLDIYTKVTDPLEQGDPYIGFLWKTSGRNELWIYPTFSDVCNLQLWFYGMPTSITRDSDTSSLPVEWHTGIVNAVINKIRVYDEQLSVSDEIALWRGMINMLNKFDVTKKILEQDGRYGTISSQLIGTSGNMLGLVDGSEKGIIWL